MSLNFTPVDIKTIDRGIYNSLNSNCIKIFFISNLGIDNNLIVPAVGLKFATCLNLGNNKNLITENFILSDPNTQGCSIVNYNI